jgi:hypothetical protein
VSFHSTSLFSDDSSIESLFKETLAKLSKSTVELSLFGVHTEKNRTEFTGLFSEAGEITPSKLVV